MLSETVLLICGVLSGKVLQEGTKNTLYGPTCPEHSTPVMLEFHPRELFIRESALKTGLPKVFNPRSRGRLPRLN